MYMLLSLFKKIRVFLISSLKRILSNSIVAVFFLYLLHTLSGINVFWDTYKNIETSFLQKKAVDHLDKMYVGTSIRYVESIFGIPVKEISSEKRNLKASIYVFENFYLQVIYDQDGTVILYSVTSRSTGFKPQIPYLNTRLGNKTFFEYGPSEFMYSALSSKFYEYAEHHYLGFPSEYRNIYLSFQPTGVEYKKIDSFSEIGYCLDECSEKSIENFRKKNIPNTFAVGSIFSERDEEALEQFGLGADFYEALSLPHLVE
ncbi:ETEC_3214 domain-containing protein [Neisseriaceae bacterium CLB008]